MLFTVKNKIQHFTSLESDSPMNDEFGLGVTSQDHLKITLG